MSSQFAFTEADQEDLINKHSYDLTIQLPDGNTIVPWVPVDAGIITLKKGTELFPINSYNKFQEMRAGLQQLMNADPEDVASEDCVIILNRIEHALALLENGNKIGIPCGIRPNFVEPLKTQLELIFSAERRIEIVRRINPNSISFLIGNFSTLPFNINSIPESEAANTLIEQISTNLPSFCTQSMELLKPYMRELQELSSTFMYSPKDLPKLFSQKDFSRPLSIIKAVSKDPNLLKQLANAFAISSKRLTDQNGFCIDITPNLEILRTADKIPEA